MVHHHYPFFVLLTASAADKRIHLLFDFGLTVGYYGVVAVVWPFLFEQAFQNNSFIATFLKPGAANYLSQKLFHSTWVPGMAALLAAVLVVDCILKNPWRHPERYDTTYVAVNRDWLYAYLRFFAGIALFIGPILLWFLRNLA